MKRTDESKQKKWQEIKNKQKNKLKKVNKPK